MSFILDVLLPRAEASAASDLVHPTGWLLDLAGARKTAAGENVNPTTAMGLSAYFASIRNISEDLAKLPGQVRRRRPEHGSDDAPEHPAYRLFHSRFNPLMSAFEGRRLLTRRALGKGNGIAELVRDSMGNVLEIWPIATERVTPPRLSDDGRELIYEIRGPTGVIPLRSRDVLHIKGAGTGFWGYSVAQLGAESIGTGLAAQRFSGAYYGEGLAKRMVAIVKEALSPGGRKKLRARIKASSEESKVDPGRRKIPIIPADVTLTDVGISASDASSIERERFTVEDVARWFRMSLSKLQVEQRAKGWSSIEGENTAYATDALGAWAVQWEQELAMKLLLPAEEATHFFKHNFGKLMQADYKTRIEGHAKQIGMGMMTPNEARALEDRNPATLEDGETPDPKADVLYIQSGFAPLGEEKPDRVPPAFGPPEPGPDEPDPDEPDDEPEDDDAQAILRRNAAALHPVFADAAARVTTKECKAVRRAVQRHAGNAVAYDAWADGFYAKFEKDVAAAFVAPYAGMAHACEVRPCFLPVFAAKWAAYARANSCAKGPEDERAALLTTRALEDVMAYVSEQVQLEGEPDE